jgi:hypothetical protein
MTSRVVRWGPLSILAPNRTAYPVEDMLPSLLSIPDYVRPVMRARHARRAMMSPNLEQLPYEAQRHGCLDFLRKLGLRHLEAECVVLRSAPFSRQYVKVTQHVVQQDPHAPPPHPLDFSSRLASRVVWRAETPQCMLHTGPKPYLNLTLAGHRSKCKSPFNEFAHRVVCWMANGPPPSDPLLLNQPLLSRWHAKNWVVGHLCGHARCLCPQHLAWMRPQDNEECRRWHEARGKGPGELWPGMGAVP